VGAPHPCHPPAVLGAERFTLNKAGDATESPDGQKRAASGALETGKLILIVRTRGTILKATGMVKWQNVGANPGLPAPSPGHFPSGHEGGPRLKVREKSCRLMKRFKHRNLWKSPPASRRECRKQEKSGHLQWSRYTRSSV